MDNLSAAPMMLKIILYPILALGAVLLVFCLYQIYAVAWRQRKHRQRVPKWRKPKGGPHTSPEECLAWVRQEVVEGGRAEYIARSGIDVRGKELGDCAVVAIERAFFLPERGAAYDVVREGLTYGEQLKSSMEGTLYNGDVTFDGVSHASIHALMIGVGYEHIFPNQEGRWHCICDNRCSYVLTVRIPEDHLMTVQGAVAYTASDFDPINTEVVNVYRLDPPRKQADEPLEDAGWRWWIDKRG